MRGGPDTLVDVLWGGLVNVSQKPRKKWNFFEILRYIYQDYPKNHFYCLFINNFPKNFEKSAQKNFTAPSAPQKPIFSNFLPFLGRWNPPPQKKLHYLVPLRRPFKVRFMEKPETLQTNMHEMGISWNP